MKNDFDTWWEEASFIEDDGCYQEKYLAAKEVWEEKDNQLKGVIERLENYPCCMSCYLSKEEMIAARDIKERFIKIFERGIIVKNSDIRVGEVYSATKPAEEWGVIDGEEVSFEEKVLRVEVLQKPTKVYDENDFVDLPEHLNIPEWFWVKNIETGREHWISTDVYTFKEVL